MLVYSTHIQCLLGHLNFHLHRPYQLILYFCDKQKQVQWKNRCVFKSSNNNVVNHYKINRFDISCIEKPLRFNGFVYSIRVKLNKWNDPKGFETFRLHLITHWLKLLESKVAEFSLVPSFDSLYSSRHNLNNFCILNVYLLGSPMPPGCETIGWFCGTGWYPCPPGGGYG